MSCVRNLRDSTLKIQDGTATPNSLTVTPMKGDLSFTVTRPSQVLMNRGALNTRRAGDETEMAVSFSFFFQQWSAASGATGTSPVDALTKAGGAAAWISTGGSCDVYAVNLVFEMVDPSDATKKETLVFPQFHADSIVFKEGDVSHEISVTGKCLASTPIRTYA